MISHIFVRRPCGRFLQIRHQGGQKTSRLMECQARLFFSSHHVILRMNGAFIRFLELLNVARTHKNEYRVGMLL
jgi:hypothetical protein